MGVAENSRDEEVLRWTGDRGKKGDDLEEEQEMEDLSSRLEMGPEDRDVL